MKSPIAVCVAAMALSGVYGIARGEGEETSSGNALVAQLEREPDPVARVVYRGHRPFIELNGHLMDPLVNICRVGDPYNERAIVNCSQVGFKIVQLNFFVDDLYKGEGVPCDFSSIGAAVWRLLRLDPKAYVILSPRFIMRQWAKDHPDEQVGYATGAADPNASDEFRERVVRPSPASDRFRAVALDVIGELGDYVNAQPWRKRLIGFRLSYGTYSEWHAFGMYEAPDTGLRMQEKFSAYMQAKRGIANARIPTIAMRRHENADTSKPSLNGDLLDPAEDQLVLDYYDCLANTMADLMLAMAAKARQSMPGRLIGAYYGYVYADHPPEGANGLLDKVLASPNIDFLSNPPQYSRESRRAGGSYVARTIPSLFRRYGKLSLLEDDSRFHHIRNWLQSKNDGQSLATETPQETEMVMRRNWLNPFFDGTGLQLNDPLTRSGRRPHAFDDPAVFKAIAESKAALAAAGEPAPESGNSIAVVFSARECLRRDGGKCSYFTWNLYQTSLRYLNRTGTAFDLLSLEDYIANPRNYTIVLFLNAFYLTDAERAALRAQTRKPGMTAVWIGPAGGVTDTGFDNAAMSALTGVTATGIARRSNIQCGDTAATRKSIPDFIFYVKTLGGGSRSIIVPQMPNSAERYKAVLGEAGAWFYTVPGNYFRRHGDIFMFHTGTVGEHVIHLPTNVRKVQELYTGEVFNTNEVTLQADGPATWLFKATTSKP
ncbi:MAG: hypothetical protein J6U40_02680 [Kiritimatiellae bacterium]|nr:hypothetical protein [Kiritimatiellia bacterium]